VAAGAKRGNTAKQGQASPGDRKGDGKSRRPRSCFFCREGIAEIDYKNVGQLRRSITDRAKIKSRTNTGTCRKHQKQVAIAIKRAREMALVPYIGDGQPPQAGPRSRRTT
jgi:small subunit ribosomal protein S18